MPSTNSSSLDNSGERILIGSCSPLEAALRYVSPDGLKIYKDQPAVSLKSNPIKPFPYWLCRQKRLPREVGSLVRQYHHGPPKDPFRVNLTFLENVVKQAENEETGRDIYCQNEIKIQTFLKVAFRETLTTDPTGMKIKAFYFPVTDGRAGARFHPSSNDKGHFMPGRHVYFIHDGELLNGIVKDVFKKDWPVQYSVACRGDAYLLKRQHLVTHNSFLRSIPTEEFYNADCEWMNALERVIKGLGARTSVVDLFACFHHCRCFSMRYDRLSWVRHKAEAETSNTRDEMIMVPDSELVIQSYLKGRRHFETHWEQFRIKEWVENDRRSEDGNFAIIPQMSSQRQELFKGCALKVEVDDSFFASFLPQDDASPPAKKLKSAPGTEGTG